MLEGNTRQDLLLTIHQIERFHQRRAGFAIHATLSLAVQIAIWANWYASYVVRGQGFQGSFFSDRFIISVVLAIFLIGHLAVMRLMEAKDRMVIRALEKYQAEA